MELARVNSLVELRVDDRQRCVAMTHIAFLRAVNLGKRTVQMPRVVKLVSGLGYEGAWTHINSGNVVFEASGGLSLIHI